MEKVKITSGNGYISGTLQMPSSTDSKIPGVLIIHGLTSKEDKYIERFSEFSKSGYACLTISLRGHGSSSGDLGSISREDHLNDVESAFKFLSTNEHVDESRIGIYGKSYGGYLAAILSSKLNPKTLVLGAPALYEDNEMSLPIADIIGKDPQAWRKHSLSPEENSALSSLSRYENETLIIIFEKDDVIPKNTTNTYLSLEKDSLHSKIVLESDHIMSKKTWDDQTTKLITHWLTEHI